MRAVVAPHNTGGREGVEGEGRSAMEGEERVTEEWEDEWEQGAGAMY